MRSVMCCASLLVYGQLAHIFLSITMSMGVPIDSGGASLRSKDLDNMHKRLVQASDGSPPWKRALAELNSTSCQITYR